MNSLTLRTYNPAETHAAKLVALALFGGGLRLWVLKFGHVSFPAVAIVGGCILASLHVIGKISKTVSIDAELQTASVRISVAGYSLQSKRLDLSKGAWVRARHAGLHFTEIVVEVGTQGYETTELLKLPYSLEKAFR